jgi:hypothetical protein
VPIPEYLHLDSGIFIFSAGNVKAPDGKLVRELRKSGSFKLGRRILGYNERRLLWNQAKIHRKY